MPTPIFLVILFILGAISSGCENTVNNVSQTPNAGTSPVQKDEPKVAHPKADVPSTSESLATPTDAYRTAYELRKNKDVEGLKKVMSEDIKEFLTMAGEPDKKTLDDMIREMCEKPQADRAEVRNEKIRGTRAELEYLTEKGDWKTMDFEKVGDKWLMTFPKAEAEEDKEPDK